MGGSLAGLAVDSTDGVTPDLGLDPLPGVAFDLVLDNQRLTAELRASQQQLRASRARLVEQADSERRRIARDLHDGLQARLVLLAIRAHDVLADPAAPPSVCASATELGVGLQAAIRELRELVHGVMPAALTERGLYAATQDLADRVPIPVELDCDANGAKLSAAVESTGYFVVSEAIANALKHSRANALVVRLARTNGHLRIEVCDDGEGGASLAAGSGIRGLADRVDAVGGRLLVESPPGGGTRVVAEVPCEA